MGLRAIGSIPVDRARLRLTATYAVTNRLRVGLEYNPLDDDLGPLATWRALDETRNRPALIFGTSSDRIGTPSGRAFFGTFSKDLESILGLPVAPYVGAAFGGFEHEFRAIGGVYIRWTDDWSSTHLWDGKNMHHLVDRALGDGYRAGLLVVEQDEHYYFGISLGASLGAD